MLAGDEAEIFIAAHDVVNSLSKGVLHVEPIEEKRTKKLEQKFLSVLPFFGSFEEEVSLLEMLLRDKMGLNNFLIRKFSPSIYWVFIPANSDILAFIIKTMEEGQAVELARELSSLQQLKDLHLHQSVFPEVQIAGKYEKECAVHTVFVETAVKGKRLSLLMKEMGQSEGEERVIKLETLRQGLKKAAVGLAELHLKNHQKTALVGQEAIAFNLSTLLNFYNLVVAEIKKGSNIQLTEEQLERIYEHVTKSVVDNWGMSGYSHGDAHLENLIFDPSSDQFAWIDTPSFLASIDPEGRPIGFPPYDFAWVWCDIAGVGFHCGLTVEEVSLLQEGFKTAYEHSMGEDLAPLPATKLALLTRQLYFLWSKSQNKEQLLQMGGTKDVLHRIQQVIDNAATSIKALI